MTSDILRGKIGALERNMKAQLDEIRETYQHSGNRGSAAEQVVREFLRRFLPTRLSVGHGEVIDSDNRISKQTDIVIANEDHPFTFTADQPGLFFVEGVSSAGEVKMDLTSTGLKEALRNSQQFKRLVIKPGAGTTAFFNPSDRERFYRCPPWFLLAFESQLQLSSIREKILSFQQEESSEVLDAVFILNRGEVLNLGDGTGRFQVREITGQPRNGWIARKTDRSLFGFVAWLSTVMPVMHRYLPILPQYMLPTWSSIPGDDVGPSTLSQEV